MTHDSDPLLRKIKLVHVYLKVFQKVFKISTSHHEKHQQAQKAACVHFWSHDLQWHGDMIWIDELLLLKAAELQEFVLSKSSVRN